MSNLAIRVLVALVGIPLVIPLTLAGGVWFLFFIALVASLALHEFYRLASAKGVSAQMGPGIVFGLGVILVLFHARLQYALLSLIHGYGMAAPLPTMAQAFLILCLVFVPLISLLELFRNRPQAMMNIAVTITGVLYVSLFLGSLVGLRELFVPGDFPVSAYFPVNGPDVPPDVESTIYRWGG